MLLDSITPHIPQITAYESVTTSYPFLVSPCVTGVRVFIENGRLYDLHSRLAPNKQLQAHAEKMKGLDGVFEAVVNLAYVNDLKVIKDVVSAETHLRDNDLIIHIHDYIDNKETEYSKRLYHITETIIKLNDNAIAYLPQKLVYSATQLTKYMKAVEVNGYEGVVIRPVTSTYQEQSLLYVPVSK